MANIDWATVLTTIGGNGLVIAYFNYHWTKKLNDTRAEREMQMFRQSHVFKITVDVVTKLHKDLIELKILSDAFFNALGRERSKEGVAMDNKKSEVITYFTEHEIFLPVETAEKIRSFYNNISTVSSASYVAQFKHQVGSDERDVEFKKYFVKFLLLPPLLTEVKRDFHNLMGFPNENQQKQPK